jgi:hypothetical protein
MVGFSQAQEFAIYPPEQQQQHQEPAFHQWILANNSVWATFYRTNSGYRIRFPDLADFTLSLDGKRIAAYPVAGVSPQTLEHLYLNQVLPLALSRQLRLVFHAGAIAIGNHAIAFLGSSGQGKSTLTASFATNGYPFLTDDGLQLENRQGIRYALPSHPSIRLWSDSRQTLISELAAAAPAIDYNPKVRLLAGGDVLYCNQAQPLLAMYFLGDGRTDFISIEPVSSRDAMIELVRHSFLLDIEERQMLSHHFAQLTDMVKKPIFFKLNYPRQYSLLGDVRDAIIGHTAGLKNR